MTVELGNDVLVQCPEEGFDNIRVIHCLKCQYYNGLSKATVGGVPVAGTSADSHHVICARPITRRLHRVLK